MNVKLRIYWILAFLFFHCNIGENDFYESWSEDDLYKVPLIKPHTLITNVSEEASSEYPDWKFQYEKKAGISVHHLNVSYVNVIDSIIYGFGEKGPTGNFIYDTKSARMTIYNNRNLWKTDLKLLGCAPDSIYKVWDLFILFKKGKRLPWFPRSKN